MAREEAAAAARALALVGVRFRPQGRRPEHGLDCVGLAAAAAGLPPGAVPAGYALRSRVATEQLNLDFDGRVRAIDPADARSGDILLAEGLMRLHHFLVLVEGGYVHADARLRRVVLTPGAVPWPVAAAWRVVEE